MPEEPRFIVDVNVGRLAKWLRVMGYDSLYIPDVEDGELVQRALEDDRIIITRDARILYRRVVTSGQLRAALVRDDAVRRQIHQVVQELGLQRPREFSRCIRCNEPLQGVPKKSVAERVPRYVYQTQREFMECPLCRKLYWRGTHWRSMRAELAEVRPSNG